ncbi:progranulin-like isoform X4 [Acipenser ruthenus]|uniref:progranulin-like isoform X4 n=1 Tax=Acipenser ruthenus TaxID=7906 RepID=UPI0027424988|nr:progranulin-like isoform X4 [Acipenser ruthenus]
MKNREGGASDKQLYGEMQSDELHSGLQFGNTKERKFEMLKVLCLSVLALASALQCPDGGTCADDNTCCKTPSGGYGCCPLPNAVCCSDHLHCCFEGTICDLVHSKCLNGTAALPWLEKVPVSRPEHPQVNGKGVRSSPMVQAGSLNGISETVCPDSSPCPSEYACLLTPTGVYGCCPLPRGLSCADGKHCCPEGYECSDDGSACNRHAGVSIVSAVICPDEESECPDETTCCQLPDGSWGCCPMVKAVCCDDKVHCCPEGTRCDIAHSKCVSHERETPMWGKLPARKRADWENDKVTKAESVACPDGKSQCPDGTTCCRMPSGQYGCCPIPNAVCCTDHEHCCPAASTCDLKHDTCTSANGKTPLLKKFPAIVRDASGVQCDDTSACADGSTCCMTRDGGWACCPLPKAECCNDSIHCCPNGYTCNVPAASCQKGALSFSWVSRIPVMKASRTGEGDVKCDDITSCTDGTTCCRNEDWGWGCCPYPKAVCCGDHKHCCPEGTVCDLAAGTCDQGGFSVPWLEKIPVRTSEPNEEKCDDQTSCPDGSTCCKLSTGDWACCPLPRAVCCDDHEHCCPKGYECDVEQQTCVKQGLSIPWVTKRPPMKLLSAAGAHADKNMCDEHTCPKEMTCCEMGTGKWGCCPLPDAVCCQDGSHCCPSGYTCDVTQRYCQKGGHTVPWFSKVAAFQNPLSLLDVKCDPQMSCAAGSTCCKLPTGKWGCCPLIKAVCCEDQEHCCPQGYQCNMKTSTCERQSPVLPWVFQKAPLYSLSAATPDSRGNDKCDDQHYCSGQQTCCKTAAGTWGCCPYSQGVCCDDLQHCCPDRYTCDGSGGKCVQRNGPSWDVLFSAV